MSDSSPMSRLEATSAEPPGSAAAAPPVRGEGGGGGSSIGHQKLRVLRELHVSGNRVSRACPASCFSGTKYLPRHGPAPGHSPLPLTPSGIVASKVLHGVWWQIARDSGNIVLYSYTGFFQQGRSVKQERIPTKTPRNVSYCTMGHECDSDT